MAVPTWLLGMMAGGMGKGGGSTRVSTTATAQNTVTVNPTIIAQSAPGYVSPYVNAPATARSEAPASAYGGDSSGSGALASLFGQPSTTPVRYDIDEAPRYPRSGDEPSLLEGDNMLLWLIGGGAILFFMATK